MNPLSQPAEPAPVAPDLGRIAEPAWIIDLQICAVLAASPAGRSFRGGILRDGMALDRATPALTTLISLIAHDPRASGIVGAQVLDLLFWVSGGAVRLRCRCSVAPERSGTVLLVLADPDPSLTAFEHGRGVELGPIDRATLAHELRTPLSAIVAIAEIMRDEKFGPMANARYRAYARDIHDTARHTLGLVDSALGASDASEPDIVEIGDTVRTVLSSMRPLADQTSVRLEARMPEDLPRVRISRRHLTQIVLNLLTNAIRVTRPEGTVDVVVSRLESGEVELAVVDNGPGMPPSEIARILSAPEPDEVRPRAPSGLGLPLVKTIARSCGGQVDISSAPGKGTRVSVLFPPDRGLATAGDATGPMRRA